MGRLRLVESRPGISLDQVGAQAAFATSQLSTLGCSGHQLGLLHVDDDVGP